MREVTEDLEAETYSTDAGSEGDAEAERKRRRPRRKRRPKPEAIAARLKTDADGEASRRSGGDPSGGERRAAPERSEADDRMALLRRSWACAGRERRFYYSPLTAPGLETWRA